MYKNKEFKFLVKANELSLSFHSLEKEVSQLLNPLNFLPRRCVAELEQSGKTDKVVGDLLRGDYKKHEVAPPKQINFYTKICFYNYNISEPHLKEYNRNIKDYVDALPEKIQILKQINRDLKQLISAADKRCFPLFKTGNLKGEIHEIINPDKVRDLLRFAEEARDNIAFNQHFFNP